MISLTAGLPATPRVLIVDDERHNRTLLSLMLASEHYAVTTAASGAEALSLVAEQPPDLILLDIMMPGMNGYDVADTLKGNPTTRHIPVIMVTALDDRATRVRSLTAGAEDFLTKPVDRTELCLRVKNLLRLKAYGDYHDSYSRLLEGEIGSRTADLVASERLYRATFDDAPVGIVHVGLDGRWLRVNQRACELLGYPCDELLGTAVQQRLNADLPSGEGEELCQLAAGDQDRRVIEERKFRRGDGSVLWARVNMSVHRDAGGVARHFILVMEDITVRRTLEAQVRQTVAQLTASEERYRTFVDGALDAIAVITPDGVIREMNQRWSEITGLPREQLVGRHVRDFAAKGRADQNAAEYTTTAAKNLGSSVPVAIATAQGPDALLEFSHTALYVNGEKLVLTIGRDVTEKVKLEEQLRQAQKLEVIGQLAAGVAHDFNNLLTAIVGFSDILIEDLPPNSPMLPDVLEIKKAGGRASGLTRQLLAFGRKQILQPRVLNVNEVISGMEVMLKRLVFAHVSVVVSLQKDIAAVEIDPTQFEQIVINLTANAADAMPTGGKLTIETSNVTLDESYRQHHLPVRPGQYVMVAVSDTGMGMDAATSQRVFEPFFTTKPVGKGTGLGLATVHGIVKQSGGDIWVYSEPGHGTTFKVYLPQVTSAAAANPYSTGEREIARGLETILLVEDEEAVRKLARVVLERIGYRVIEAENPKVAFVLAREFDERIDLLLSDVIMPESEGPPLFLRLLDARPDLRVLYMSGYADEAIVRHGVIVEGTPFLQKPFTPSSLAAKIRDVLDAPARPAPCAQDRVP